MPRPLFFLQSLGEHHEVVLLRRPLVMHEEHHDARVGLGVADVDAHDLDVANASYLAMRFLLIAFM